MNGSSRRCATGVIVLAAAMLLSAGCDWRRPSIAQLLSEARVAQRAGNYSAAILHLKNAVGRAPENAEVRQLLGMLYGEVSDFLSAEQELRRALDLRPDGASIRPRLGKALLAQGEYQKVLDEVIIERHAPGAVRAEALTVRALALIALARIAEGHELIEQALAIEPEFSEALLALARLAAVERDPERSAALIDRVLASAPRSVDAWLLKGDLAQLTGSAEDVEAAYIKVLELQPGHVSAGLNLAALQIAAGRFDAARTLLDPVRKVVPNSAMVRYLDALIDFRHGRQRLARDAILQVSTVAPGQRGSNDELRIRR